MKERGNFETSPTGPYLIKTRDGLTLRNKCVLVLFYYDPRVIGRSRVRCESPQAPRKRIPLFGRDRTKIGVSVLDMTWN